MDNNGDGMGEPRSQHPVPGSIQAFRYHALYFDSFAGDKSGLQWQWQANPRQEWYSMTENPEALRLNTCRISRTSTLFHAGQFLSQLMQYHDFRYDGTGNTASGRVGMTVRVWP